MLQYDFMQRAFLAGSIISLIAGVLGVYLMLRRQALMADMLSHVSLAGVAAGVYLRINPTWSSFAIAVVGAIAVEYMRRTYRAYSEVSIAVIMIGGLASAVVLMSMNEGLNKSISSYLFGSIVAVNQTELWLIGLVGIIGGLFFAILRKPLYLMTFDEETAKANGLPISLLSMLFSVITGMIVAAAMPIVGVLLVSALIVLPAALAIRIARGFTLALVLAMVIGLAGVCSGLTASYKLSTPPGGTIALVLLLFLCTGIGVQAVCKRVSMGWSLRKQALLQAELRRKAELDRALRHELEEEYS